MSVITSRPGRYHGPCTAQIYQHDGATSAHYRETYSGVPTAVPSRTSSVSSFSNMSSSSNYTTSTAPSTIYSPTLSTYRLFKSPSPPPRSAEPPFQRTPMRVFDCILEQLQSLHSSVYQTGCDTCFQRDLHSLALTSRAWERAARKKLYSSIHILGNDAPVQLKRYRLKRGSRLRLLRRTLRERRPLANLVLELQVAPTEPFLLNGRQNPLWEDFRDLVASVVMLCPNLERLIGLDMPYYHDFDRLTHALSTRKNLKEHKWILGEQMGSGETISDHSPHPSLDPQRVFEFLNYHESWANLETLMLHALHMNSGLEHGIFLRMFNRLPSLRHLNVSSFDANSFTDRTLLFLPALESLRLENLPGITDRGLVQYTSRQEASSLKSFTLIEQNVESLSVLSKIFTSLRKLQRFSIVQTETCPTVPSGDMVFQPVLASSSLKWLHWDVASPDPLNVLGKLASAPFALPHPQVDTPNYHLAQSILHRGFPLLGQLRAPSDIDPPGILQSVCRPVSHGRALIPVDRYSLPRSSHGSVNTRPLALPGGNNLTSARIRAQTFIDMAAKDTEHGMKVIITDYSDSYIPDNALEVASDTESELDAALFEGAFPLDDCPAMNRLPRNPDGPVKVCEFRMPSVMGQARCLTRPDDVSIPRFLLRPDIPGAEADGGIIGWKHLLSSNQCLSHAANASASSLSSPGDNTFNRGEDAISPTSTSSRFSTWSGFGGRSTAASSVTTSASPPLPMSFGTNNLPPWARDVCNGSWNQAHRSGEKWWSHIERERPGQHDVIAPKQFF